MNTETKNYESERKILDSGNRREFTSGAVRDIAEGKGRCDLLPLDIIGEYMASGSIISPIPESTKKVLDNIAGFIYDGDPSRIYLAITIFMDIANYPSIISAILEVSKHYEEGAKKYDERNWEKGIPAHCYIDSGVRHFLKWLDKREDEPHDRAFLWNMFGLMWTLKHHPELNDLPYRKCEETVS